MMIGERIRRAREAQGLSLRTLGERLGLSHAAIKKYEDNRVTPSSQVLMKLSKELHVEIDYFFRPEIFIPESIQWRKDADMPARELDQISAIVLDCIGQRIELENLFPQSPVRAFEMSFVPKAFHSLDDVEKFSEKVRSEWDLGEDPIPDLIDVIEEYGVKVFQIDNQKYSKFDGLYTKINEVPVIAIGKDRPGDRQRFTLLHELGHLFFEGRMIGEMDIEKCCNRFAGAFLLPKTSLRGILGIHRNNIEIRELELVKQEFGISMASILHRLEETSIISESLYSDLRKQFKQRGWDKVEPGEPYPKPKSRIFEQMIFHALAEEYIGESKAAELMNISIHSFRSLRAMESQYVANH